MDIIAAGLVVRQGIVYFRFCGFGLMSRNGGVMVAVVGLGIRFGDRLDGWTDGRAREGGGFIPVQTWSVL